MEPHLKFAGKSTPDRRALRPQRRRIDQITIDLVCTRFRAGQGNRVRISRVCIFVAINLLATNLLTGTLNCACSYIIHIRIRLEDRIPL